MHQRRLLAVLAIAAVIGAGLSGLAVVAIGDFAVGALLGALVVLAALGLRQQARYARRSAADVAAVAPALNRGLAATTKDVASLSKDVATLSKDVAALSKDVASLSRTVTTWSKNVKVAEIESGIDALNRYVALGSDDTAHGA